MNIGIIIPKCAESNFENNTSSVWLWYKNQNLQEEIIYEQRDLSAGSQYPFLALKVLSLYLGQDEWVIDLELMSVRKKYRHLNIGKYLINLIQNKNYVGNFDAIVTSSDLDAIKFYEKFGFSIDPILNSKYKFIGIIRTNIY